MCSDVTPTVPTHKYELLDMRDYPLDAEITYMCCVGRYSLNLILGYSNTFLSASPSFPFTKDHNHKNSKNTDPTLMWVPPNECDS